MMVREQGFELQEILEPPELKEIFDNLISELPEELLETIKTFVETNLSKIIGIDGKLEIRIVVDANMIFAQTKGYIEHGSLPSIIRLSKSPFVKMYAPSKIFEDTLENEDELAKLARKITRRLGREIAVEKVKQKMSEILEHIEILDPEKDKEFEMAQQLIGSRDPDDVDYVHLYLSIKATGIITRDSDFDDLPNVQTWKDTEPVKELRAILTKGSISFALTTTSGAVMVDLLFKIVAAILGIILGIFSAIWKNLERLVKWVIDGFSRLPNELKVVIAVAMVVLGYGFREEIKEALEKIRGFIGKVIEFLRQISEFILKTKDQISLYGGEITKAMESLLLYSAQLIQLYEKINLEDFSQIGEEGISSA